MQTKHALVWAALVATALVAACGGPPPLKDPFAGLQAGVCLDDSECEVGRCPNACNLGQAFCMYPGVYARKDILRKCPCAETPSAATCQPPDVSACGPTPRCASPSDATNLRAKCISGMCAARMTDGGIPP